MRQLFVLFLVTMLLWGCGLAGEDEPDYWPTQSWKTSSPESQGMDSSILLNMLEVIWERDIKIDSVLVVRNGYAVLDAYSYPRDKDDRHNIYSCSKSVTSALIGIAIDKGFIKGVDRPVLDFFPEHVAKNLSEDKKAMTLEDLLTMTTGLECRDNYRHRWVGLRQMEMSPDWVQFMIDLPMAEKPGAQFNYCNGATFLLSAILQQQTGMNARSFAEKHLFEPLGISGATWRSNHQGITFGFGRIYMRPRDMAKFGYLYLNNGLWEGKRIISAHWVKESTRKHVAANWSLGYGYQWWTTRSGEYTALGYGGQFIYVVPDKNIVAVFTSHLDQKDTFAPAGLLHSNILAAVKSDKPLPENPQVEKELIALAALWQETSPKDREKIRSKAEKPASGMLPGEYVNNEYGFSAKYDARLMVTDDKLQPGVVFRRKGVEGVPMFNVVVEDIPRGVELKDTGELLIEEFRKIPQIRDPEIRKQQLITLPDGTGANYGEITWKYRSYDMQTVAVAVFKDGKIIGVSVSGTAQMPTEYLTDMAKSLRLKK